MQSELLVDSPHPKLEIETSRVVGELTARQIRALSAAVPNGEVRLERDLLETYGRDESPLPSTPPAAVVFPSNATEVAAVMAFAHRERIPVTPRGAGSGKVGGAIPLYGGVVLALERMNRIIDLDVGNRLALVEPGVITGVLRTEVEDRGLYYPPNPNSLDICSIGGNVASNAAGPCSMKYGATRSHVLGLEVVLADGTFLKLGRKTTKSSTGYDLTGLIVGSEGTLAVVTGVTLRLSVRPAICKTLFATFPSAEAAVGTLTDLYRAGIIPAAAEFFDRSSLEAMATRLELPHEAGAGLLFEIDGSETSVEATLEEIVEVLGDRAGNALLAGDQAGVRRFWDARKEVSVLIKERYAWRRSEDIAVPPARLPAVVNFIEQLKDETGLRIVAYGHAGDGNLHVNFLYQEPERHQDVEAAVVRLFRKALELEGTLSGEHGIGATKRRFMPMEQADSLLALQKRLKKSLDPHDILNPGKVFP